MPVVLPHCVRAIWHRSEHIQPVVPEQYASWLLDKGSLTRKLVDKSAGKLRVEVLQQTIQQPLYSESQALKLANRRWAVVREVILYGDGQPWVYARTAIPLHTLHGPLRRLHYLGNKPLGEQLFTDPTMEREPVEVALLAADDLPKKLGLKEPCWGRRSVFRLSNKPLLVSEVFLPELFSE